MALTAIQQQIVTAANAAGVPPSLALAVAQKESAFNPNATSPPNPNGTVDYGVMQLNSANLTAWGVTNPLDPTQNINAGVNYLAQLLQQYNGNQQMALAAYNGGPGAVTSGSNSAYVASVAANQNAWNVTLGSDPTLADPTAADPTADPSSSGTIDLFGTPVDTTTAVIGGIALVAMAYMALR